MGGSRTSTSGRRLAIGFLLMVLAMGLALVAAEVTVRVVEPYNVGQAGTELGPFRGDQERVAKLFELDPELGFRPVLGSPWFDELGVAPHAYSLEDRAGRQRVLFIGDSVTERAKIVRALQALYGDGDHEYWNGGVGSYNTRQEVLYYERYLARTRPDHVVLTFHQNDFMSTPICFADRDGRMRVIAPSKNRTLVNPWLFVNSHLYRYWIGRTRSPDTSAAEREIRTSLERLIHLLRPDGIRLSVLVLPYLKPQEEWRAYHHERHRWALETLHELGVPSFDLLPAMRRALADGVAIQQVEGDHDHPSNAVAAYFAADLYAAGLLASDQASEKSASQRSIASPSISK